LAQTIQCPPLSSHLTFGPLFHINPYGIFKHDMCKSLLIEPEAKKKRGAVARSSN
jgi:hypothetical protein